MGSRFLRHPLGPISSPQLRGTRYISPRASSLLLGATLAAGALLVVPQTRYAWAIPSVGGDENGPKVQIVSPAYQDVLKGRARILVTVKATQYNPSTIQLFLDDKAASDVLPLSSFASSSFDWDTRLTADGQHKLSVRVTDTQGFRGWSDVDVYVNNQNVRDTVAPDLNWGNIEPFQQLSGQAQIQLQAKDNFGVKWIIVSLNPASKATAQPAQRSWLLSKPPYNFNFDTTKVTDGLYALSARAWDAMEQEGKSPTLTVGIVNSPVNATTVAESLDGLKAMAKAQSRTTAAATAPASTQARTNFVEKPPTPKPDAYSGGSGKTTTAKATTPKATTPAPSSIPEGYTLLVPKVTVPKVTVPKTGTSKAATATNKGTVPSASVKPRVTMPSIGGNTAPAIGAGTAPTVGGNTAPAVEVETPGIEVTANATETQAAAPTLSAPTAPSQLDATTATPATGVETEASSENPTLVARASEPEKETRTATVPSATLSAPGTSSDVLAPALSSEAPTGQVEESDPVLVARLGTPEMAPRNDAESTTATLSSHSSAVAAALAPARAPQVSEEATGGVEVARVALPAGASRGLEVKPVLNAEKTTLTVPALAPAPAKVAAAAAPAPAPATPKRTGGLSKAVLRQPQQEKPRMVSKIVEKLTAPARTLAKVILKTPKMVAKAPEAVANTAPQLSQPKAQNNGVVTRGAGASASTAQQASRIAALPKTGSADGNAVEVAPGATMVNPVITVSPVKVAFDKSSPTFYQARHNTTLRAVAQHYGLPVELVAAQNNWTTDMTILKGMKVQLPRQVQVSYNGQKLRGDVASVMAGDTTFTAMRFLFEHTGGTISWDGAKQEVVATKGGSTIRVKIGSKTATVNNKEVMMQLAAFLFEGRTMVPARLFEDGLNAQVEWNPQTGRMVVAMAG